MATKPNPYPNREYGVGARSYTINEEGLKFYRKLRQSKICQLECGEAEFLYDVPRIIGGGNIANLGHARGGSAMMMGHALISGGLKGHVYSIELFQGNWDRAIREGNVRSIMKKFEVDSAITLCRGTTHEWSEKIDKQFNFIFVDADHSFKSVEQDFLDWSLLLNVGGMISFHDTNQAFSHDVLVKHLIGKPGWKELTKYHINRIRVFEKESK